MLRRSIALVAAVLALGVTGPPAGGAVLVKATYNLSGAPVFQPRRTVVAPGTRVVWRSVNGTHTVTAYGGNWSKNVLLTEGMQTGRTFNTPGVFKYQCTLHSTITAGVCSGMCGRIVVG